MPQPHRYIPSVVLRPYLVSPFSSHKLYTSFLYGKVGYRSLVPTTRQVRDTKLQIRTENVKRRVSTKVKIEQRFGRQVLRRQVY